MLVCRASCLANRFDFTRLRDDFLQRYRSVLYRDVLAVERSGSWLMVFEYGVIIGWGVSADDWQHYLQDVDQYVLERLATAVDDEFSYEQADDGVRIRNDHIRVDTTDVMQLLAVSHAIAQSVKLAQFEAHTDETIQSTVMIPERIARTGRSGLGRREIARMRGRLFLAKSDIILNFGLLDIPDFFWEYPEQERTYESAVGYLELKQRIDVLSKRLETIHELFGMLADEQKHQHSSMLEWIIIWLIAIEIVLFLVHDIWLAGG